VTGSAAEAADGFAIFLATAPGLEPPLREEAQALGFAAPETVPGGVLTRGGWPEVWRANLMLRGASRVLARVASFRALHLAQLDKRARKVPWAEILRPDVPVKIEASCARSRIYHAGAAAERVKRAIRETVGAKGAGAKAEEADAIRVLVRLDDDLCTISVDASGAPLHKRGAKQAMAKAPLRETMAALLLRACGYAGAEPVLDPMCGSGTFVLEAAEIAAGLAPGRARDFAFERLASFDAASWTAMRAAVAPRPAPPWFYGFDRDAGAVAASAANAARAGLEGVATFQRQAVSAFAPPEALADAPPGLVMVNPPYGGRIGDRDALRPLYGTLGAVLKDRFPGWRVGLVTSEPALAAATGLPFGPPGPPIPHGALKIRLYRTEALAG
jgi:putative N6-adenine-specific DNA methylase